MLLASFSLEGLANSALAMPGKRFPDGPTCDQPERVAEDWWDCPILKERVKRVGRLIEAADVKKGGSEKRESEKGEEEKKGEPECLPTRANTIHNSQVILCLAKDMARRGRLGADPIEVISKMTFHYYSQHPVYAQLVSDVRMKVWAYNDAWSLHKMVTQFRGPVMKYTNTRATCSPSNACSFFLNCSYFLALWGAIHG